MLCLGKKEFHQEEGGVEIVVEELCTRMVAQGHNVTCYNRGGHHVSGSEYDSKRLVQPEDVEGLSKAIVKLAENPKLRSEIARNGLETARMLDWHNATELFEKCMWEALICYDT